MYKIRIFCLLFIVCIMLCGCRGDVDSSNENNFDATKIEIQDIATSELTPMVTTEPTTEVTTEPTRSSYMTDLG